MNTEYVDNSFARPNTRIIFLFFFDQKQTLVAIKNNIIIGENHSTCSYYVDKLLNNWLQYHAINS